MLGKLVQSSFSRSPHSTSWCFSCTEFYSRILSYANFIHITSMQVLTGRSRLPEVIPYDSHRFISSIPWVQTNGTMMLTLDHSLVIMPTGYESMLSQKDSGHQDMERFGKSRSELLQYMCYYGCTGIRRNSSIAPLGILWGTYFSTTATFAVPLAVTLYCLHICISKPYPS
ncbi:hypothetical protein BDD12DRAFT_205289 [Trichophaea hybrida]|nr:hypothetical protein BDD12DRAFT_205289 [Trichophaea hybrida]